MGRALGAFAIALVALQVHYVLALGALLNSAVLARLMNPRPERARVEWGLAWSLWPGRLNVRGLRIVGQGLEIQWELSVDRAHGNVRILPLLRRQFDANGVHAFGASLRLRPRVERTKQRLQQAEVFPPIAGVEEPLRMEGPLPPPEERAWTVHLRDAKVHSVHEVWIGPHRARTQGWVEGTLHTRAGWSVAFDATGALKDTAVFIGERQVLEHGQADLRASLELPDIPHTIGPDRVRALSGTLRARSEKVSLAIIGQHAPRLADQIRGGGRLELEAALVGGELLPGSRLRFSGTDGVYALRPDLSVQADRFEVAAEVDGAQQTQVTLTATPLSLSSEGEPLVTSPRFALRVDSPNAIVVPPLPDHRLSLKLDRTEPAPVKRFARWLEGLPVALTHGSLRLEMQADGTRLGEPSGQLRAWLSDVRGSFSDGRFAGDLALELQLDRLMPARRLAVLSGSNVSVKGLSLETPKGRVNGWSGRLSLEDATLRFGSQRLVARLRGAASDAEPLLLLGRTGSALRRVLASRDLRLDAALDLSPHRRLVPRFELRGRGLQLRGGVLHDDRGTFGALLARVHLVPMGVTFEGAEPALSFAVREEWLEERLRETGVTQAADAANTRGVGGAGAAQ